MNHFEKKFEQKTGINFQKFYKDQKPKLTWYLSKWTKDLEIAEDFADDAFVKALMAIDSYNGEKSQVHTWIYTIAVNFVKKDYHDKQKLPLISIDRELSNSASINIFLPYNDTSNDIMRHKEISKKAEIVRDAIFNMPEKQHKYRQVLIMREIENMSYNEISEYLKLNLSTVKSQIKKGRELICKKVEKKLAYIDEHGLE
ncbi:MAG: RNA polymerase sigma factor [Ignavibacteria bacterium]|nr:RNA polymerase sigma factor [Ignavibacteria bacterium]